MRREFYSSTFNIILKIFFLVIPILSAIISINGQSNNPQKNYIIIIKNVLYALGAFGVFTVIRNKGEPVIVVTETSVIYKNVLGIEQEVKIKDIISAKVNENALYIRRKLRLKHRKNNGKTDSLSIDLYEVANQKELINLLKQKIKFE